MLVEPNPIRPFRRGGRLATICLVIGPLVVIAFPATQAPSHPPPRTSDAPAEAAESFEPPSDTSLPENVGPEGFPGVAFGLPVRTVAATLEAGVTADLDGGLVAVSGFLSSDPAGIACIVPEPLSGERLVRCPRLIVVIDHPGATVAATADPDLPPTAAPNVGEPHLQASIPPDSALAAALGPTAGPIYRPARSLAVILIGRLGRPSGSCVAAAGWCRGDLAILRVAWAGGEWRNWVIVGSPGPRPRLANLPTDHDAGA